MAKWTKNKVTPEQINNGNEYTVNDNVSIEELNGIVNNSFKAQEDAERALELATGANKANGTVVEINGEPQGTWDATFSQKLYEDSYNLLDVSKFIGTSGFESAKLEDNGYEITGATGSADGWNYANSNVKLTLEAGTYYLNYDIVSTNSNSALNIFKSDNSVIRYGKGSFTLTEKTDIGIMVKVFAGGSLKINITPTTTMMNYQKFNPNRHITNNEAEYLKEEFDKQVNLIDFKDSLNRTSNGITSSYEYNTGGIKIKGTATASWSSIAYDVACNLKSGEYIFSINTVKSYNVILQIKTKSGNFNKYVSIGNLSNTFTIEEDIIGYTIFLENLKSGTTYDEIIYAQLQKGKIVTEYNKYNSASHITNGQADLLKSEWEKGLNKLNFNDFKNHGTNQGKCSIDYVNKTITMYDPTSVDHYTEILKNLQLKPNTTYTYSVKATGDYYLYVHFGNRYPHSENTHLTFTTDETGLLYYVRVDNRSLSTNVFSELTLVEGDKPLSLEYNGSIIHKKDITPVLLWSNGNPNINFEQQEITLNQNMDIFKRIRVKYKTTNTSKLILEKILEYSIDAGGFLSTIQIGDDNINTLRTRLIKIISQNKINFGVGKLDINGISTNNSVIIPVSIEGLYY